MRETKIYCDHCGKVIDNMNDHVDVDIDVLGFINTDLCAECVEELQKIVLEFCRKEVIY